VYCDNLFTNVKLCAYLLTKNYGCCGTCRTNSGINADLVAKKKEWKDNPLVPWGEISQLPSVDTHVLQSIWQDSAPTLLLSTAHQPIAIDPSLFDREQLQDLLVGAKLGPHDEYTVRQRTRHRNNTMIQKAFTEGRYKQHLEMPTAYADYNDFMDGPDVHDHLKSTNPMHRRQRLGGWRALFNFLMKVALVNSYLLSGFRTAKPLRSQAEFRRQLVVALLSHGGRRPAKRKHPDATPLLDRQQHYRGSNILYHQFGKRQSSQECTICHAEPEPRLKRRVLGVLDGNARTPGLKKKRSTFGCIICDVSTCKEGGKDGDCFKKHCNIA
jgi:hypothetical protein